MRIRHPSAAWASSGTKSAKSSEPFQCRSEKGPPAWIRGGSKVNAASRAPLARAHGAVHVPGPNRRRLGPGPVQPATGLAQGGAELRPGPGREVGAVAPARPLLVGPVHLHVLPRRAGPGPEGASEALEDGLAPAPLGPPSRLPGLVPLHEA